MESIRFCSFWGWLLDFLRSASKTKRLVMMTTIQYIISY
jgi:hypothetical protein